jgi:hypothetical protein
MEAELPVTFGNDEAPFIKQRMIISPTGNRYFQKCFNAKQERNGADMESENITASIFPIPLPSS